VQNPDKADILRVAERIQAAIHHTPVLTSTTFDRMTGAELFFKCENFQKAGAFKSRGAVNAVLSLSEDEAKRGVATHSSGNHAQALARAASIRKIPAFIVMPSNSPQVKIDAVKQYGGIITFCKPTLKDRENTLQKVIAETHALEIHPYDNFDVIAGQATAAKELLEEIPDIDLILSPVGGGGLLSGTALSAAFFSGKTEVIACEPAGADDAERSFRAGRIIPSIHPVTPCPYHPPCQPYNP
jgi:threonine dehydratase